MKRILFIQIWLFSIITLPAQTFFCSYGGENQGPSMAQITLYGEVEAQINTMVKDILRPQGILPNFTVKADLILNAMAWEDSNRNRFISYHPHFIKDALKGKHGKWAVYGVLAHEIGHHLNNNPQEGKTSRPDIELQADYYSGVQLGRMGATLEQAQACLYTVPDHPQAFGKVITHPPLKERLAAVKRGWNEGKKSAPTQPSVQADTPTPTTNEDLPDDMVLVDGGSFMMGCEAKDGSCERNERPVHEVTVKSFYMDIHEVTNAEYAEFLNEMGNQFEEGSTWINIESSQCKIDNSKGIYTPSPGYDDHPTCEVSWYGAVAYGVWKSRKTGKRYRLPKESEWEYAARGGKLGKGYQYAGSDDLRTVGWHGANAKQSPEPVGRKDANELGLYDMSGNVGEWCINVYKNYSSTQTTKDEKTFTKFKKGRYSYIPTRYPTCVIRGGRYGLSPNYCRVTYRSFRTPNTRDCGIGFRLVREL